MSDISSADVDNLKRFVQRAERLVTSTFWTWMQTRRGASDMQRIIAGDWLAHDGLSQEALDSFCMSLRLLTQDTDGFSIRLVAEIAEKWPKQHFDLREEVRAAREVLQKHYAEDSLVQLYDDKRTTKEELFKVVFYGGLVHENRGKRDLYDQITTAGPFAYFVFQVFISVLFHLRSCILRMAVHIERYLIREGVIPES